MKAARINQWGQPYQFEDIAQPAAQADEVLVRVYASSVNPIDSMVLAGYMQAMVTVPMTGGTDFAGEVAAVGANVTHVKPGEAVYGMVPLRGGAFAEYIAVKANEVAHKPTTLDYAHSAAVPLVSAAAWQAVFDLAHVTAGDRVLIHGAGGNVGSVAAQLCKLQGAYVIAVDLPNKAAFLRELGADQVIDTQAERFEDVVSGVTVVLNFATDELLERSYSVLKSGGRYVTALQKPPQEEADRRGITIGGVFSHPTPELLGKVAHLVDTGKLKIIVQRTFPFSELQEAMAYRQSGENPGKIVVRII